jgi:hypothetical protein
MQESLKKLTKLCFLHIPRSEGRFFFSLRLKIPSILPEDFSKGIKPVLRHIGGQRCRIGGAWALQGYIGRLWRRADQRSNQPVVLGSRPLRLQEVIPQVPGAKEMYYF